jgi:hypothetical protein
MAHRRLFQLRDQFARASRRMERPKRIRRWVWQGGLAVTAGLAIGAAVAALSFFAGVRLPLPL